ncbi:MAG: hypothetical protein CSA38_02335 [Flavobacteriales bacterium]|nr:MAG: hypothetical protein CSA38_02335 [Flavobacteriales bacterium]
MVDLIKNYATKKAMLLKLEATEKSSLATGNIVVLVLLALLGLFFTIILSIGISLLIGNYLDNYAYGFLIVAGVYLLLFIIVFMSKKSIQRGIANKVIQSINQ